ncbi:MAG: TrkA family potassium uptake protein [Methanosarcinales archaeon]|nr:TrkA family potassium uptake protein [Methanosarcinales archaeon]MCK4651960.1 TrkA family potassium uptake protein [Methanosarcinales archaeon]
METKHEHVVVVGYGDVGKGIVTELVNAKVEFTVVDKNEDAVKGRGFDYVVGDGASEEVLMSAGVASASTVIIALNTDTDAIFATLVARTLAPDAIILARANAPICGKIYKAGADYVASLSIVVGQMIAKLAISEHEEDVLMLYEDMAIERYHVEKGSLFAGKTLEELDLRSKVGCTVIAIEKDEKTIIDLHGNTVIEADSILAIVGRREQIRKFEEYEHTRPESPEKIIIEKIGELFR